MGSRKGQSVEIRQLKHWVEQLSGKHVIVIGDVILDEYLIGKASRLSREAPVPVLEFMERRLIPGGAANPAANIAALGSHAYQLSVIGSDEQGQDIRIALQARGIDTAGLVTDAGRPTTVKTRILAHQGLSFPQQVARLDHVDRTPIDSDLESKIAAHLTQIAHADAILVSDYLSGLVTESLVTSVTAAGKANGVLLTADAQGELAKYAGFDVVKCNRAEAANALGRSLDTDEEVAGAGRELMENLNLSRAMLITRGADGITVIERDGTVTHLRQLAGAKAEVFDTVGAGDTVIAVLTLALTAGAPAPEAAMLANVAAGLVVRRVGNYAPPASELLWALDAWADNRHTPAS